MVTICYSFLAWLILATIVWSLFSMVWTTLKRAQQMHRIPCAQCQFFTHNYYLKCPVHPKAALSDTAIYCPDYAPASRSPVR